MLVLLDSKPLGMVTHPGTSDETDECNEWLEGLLERKVKVRVPEIIDYELRRTYVHRDKQNSIALLDNLASNIGYLRLNTETFLLASALWGKARKDGEGTAPPERLDIDCILAAQSHQASASGEDVRIATVDVSDLSRYDTDLVKAVFWRDIN